MPELVGQLKTAGYKIVQMTPKAPGMTLATYDDAVRLRNPTQSGH